MKVSRLFGLVCALAIACALLLAGCGGGGGGGSQAGSGPAGAGVAPAAVSGSDPALPPAGGSGTTYVGTQSPGDAWQWSLGDSTFTASNVTRGYGYSGSRTVLSTGFMKLEFHSSNDPGIAAGTIGYAFEVPGTWLMIQPPGAGACVIACTSLASAPPPSAPYNWIRVPRNPWQADDYAWGTAQYTWDGTHGSFRATPYTLGGALLPEFGQQDYTWKDGVFVQGESMLSVLGGGPFALDSGPNAGGALGCVAPKDDFHLASPGLQDASFRGFVFRMSHPGQKTRPVGATYDAAGQKVTAWEYSDVENDARSGNVTVTFQAQPLPGVVRAQVDDNGTTASMIVVLNQVSGRLLLLGTSAVDTGSGLEPYQVMLIQQ